MTDAFVHAAGVTLATRDHGGTGSPVLLIPGAGRTLEDFTPLAPLLAAEHRVLSMDLRCHGLSGTAPFAMDAVQEDVLAVVEHYGLQRPAVVGHSLGGMFAALLATRPGVLSAAVNLDGHGSGRPGQYVGLSDDDAAVMRADMRAMQQTGPPALTEDAIAAMRPAVVAKNAARGVSEELTEAIFARSVSKQPDGTYASRPDAASTRQMLAGLDALDLLATYRRTTVPLLVYNCTADDLPPGLPEWVSTYMRAYRAGLRRDLSAMAADLPLVSTIELSDSGHDLHLDHTELVARQVNDFLRAA